MSPPSASNAQSPHGPGPMSAANSSPAVYRVEIKPRAERELHALPDKDQLRIIEQIDRLAIDPHPPGSAKISGRGDIWRLRQGDYRIIYQVADKVRLVVVTKIGHRREVYR